ncbi:MAG: ABC transporter ATP-binding protein [Candidatus Sericytochromatia bacterium]|nr:ABC transporter ATP-binding protein [Candidatus Sericytochromatia bacterium]
MPNKKSSLVSLLKSYKKLTFLLIVLAILSNGINLALPKIIAHSIDSFSSNNLVIYNVAFEFIAASTIIFILMYLQGITQTYISEKVARDLRENLAAKISRQSYVYIQETNPAKLLTNMTSDIDNVKLFVSQAIVNLVASFLLIIGSSVLLLMTNWKLACFVLLIIPIIAVTFFLIIKKVRVLFKKASEVIDWLNKVINENILGSALIRVINVEEYEYDKFLTASTNARDIGLKILSFFSILIPIIVFVSNIASLVILTVGGSFVINNTMTLGDFSAFNAYLSILVFPILLIGFMSSLIAQANVSYKRISEILDAPEKEDKGTLETKLNGQLDVIDLSLKFGEKYALKNISFSVKAGTKTAIIGPTGTGKTQLLYLLTGLTEPTSGEIKYDNHDINEYTKDSLHQQIGLVFQDSIMFNMSLKENISFNTEVSEANLQKAIMTAELNDFIQTLPQKLDTYVLERGTSLSGGQKQRIMLARALALNPKILFLDDFTARVDKITEKKILTNIEKNYPEMTLLSVTQKIESVENYEEIILLTEGELLSKGTHQELMDNSPEYVQIYNSQKSTNNYELRT